MLPTGAAARLVPGVDGHTAVNALDRITTGQGRAEPPGSAAAARGRGPAGRERFAVAAGLHEPALAGHVAVDQTHDGVDHLVHRDDREALAHEGIADRGDDRGLGEARADGVDPNVVGGEHGCERAHEAHDRVLVGGVDRVHRHGGESGERGGRHDRAPPRALSAGSTAWTPNTTPSMLTPIALRYWARSKPSPSGVASAMPALRKA